MSELTSNEVPQKFAEWLLAMGCHQDIVPPVEKVAEKCRGQYYMVWRSLMEKVEPQGVIKNKRPQVFCDDIRRCQKKNIFNERDANTIVPEELLVWHRHTQLKEKVADAEARVNKQKEERLRQLADKANSKLNQRFLLQRRLQDRQRQALFLQRLADKLRDEKTNLVETRTIAESLCGLTEDTEVESTLDRCISSLTRQSPGSMAGASLAPAANPAASFTSASTSTDNNDEELLSSVAQCRGEVLFKHLYERRAGLCSALPANHPTTTNTRRVRSVVCRGASLHCSLALEAAKNRIHSDRARIKLAREYSKLDSHLSREACELLVTRCEVACSEARIAALRSSVEDLENRRGIFHMERPTDTVSSCTTIQAVDKAIELKRTELKRLIASVAAVERKTQNVRECLLSRFNGFHNDGAERDRFGGSTSLPQETISGLRQFFEEKRELSRNKRNLSMNLDVSDNCSFNNLAENGSPTFIDELKLYLNKFSLEKNRKFVLESGQKIWIFESISSSLHDVHSIWQGEDISTHLLCPSVVLKWNLRRLLEDVERKSQLETLLRTLDGGKRNRREIDISSSKDEEQKTLDSIKKRLNDNILSLQKTSKTLDIGLENLQLWADNNTRKYMREGRKVGGKTYVQYEKAYLNS